MAQPKLTKQFVLGLHSVLDVYADYLAHQFIPPKIDSEEVEKVKDVMRLLEKEEMI